MSMSFLVVWKAYRNLSCEDNLLHQEEVIHFLKDDTLICNMSNLGVFAYVLFVEDLHGVLLSGRLVFHQVDLPI